MSVSSLEVAFRRVRFAVHVHRAPSSSSATRLDLPVEPRVPGVRQQRDPAAFGRDLDTLRAQHVDGADLHRVVVAQGLAHDALLGGNVHFARKARVGVDARSRSRNVRASERISTARAQCRARATSSRDWAANSRARPESVSGIPIEPRGPTPQSESSASRCAPMPSRASGVIACWRASSPSCAIVLARARSSARSRLAAIARDST